MVFQERQLTYIPVRPLDLRLQLLRQALQEPKLPEADDAAQGRHNAQAEDCQAHFCMPRCKVRLPMHHLACTACT